MKSGTNQWGRAYGRRTENVMVRNATFGYSYGLAIGTQMSAGIKNVTFHDIMLNGSFFMTNVKSTIGRGGK